ncbi:MAG: GNAT family N-acetyltransferase [Bacteroidetes bacterium]|nr:GNAT family N-acetyltransferase [Bacteroidota bacterium]
MDITVLEANLHDPVHAKHILELLNTYANDIMGGGKDLSENVQKNLITELQKRSNTLIVLAYDNTSAIGLAICFEGFSTFYAKPLLNIHDFVVVANYRGKGIAKLLLEKLEKIAVERGCCKLTLEVLEGNKRAQVVYSAFGFNGYELDANTGKALFWEKKLG